MPRLPYVMFAPEMPSVETDTILASAFLLQLAAVLLVLGSSNSTHCCAIGGTGRLLRTRLQQSSVVLLEVSYIRLVTAVCRLLVYEV